MLRSITITRDAEGKVTAKHYDGRVLRTIEFHSPQELWNFVTLDVSRDRTRYARPPRRNRKEEEAAIAAWDPPPPPSEEDLLAAASAQREAVLAKRLQPREAGPERPPGSLATPAPKGPRKPARRARRKSRKLK